MKASPFRWKTIIFFGSDNTGFMILTINGGSSSIKFSLYRTGVSLEPALKGKIDRIGLPGPTLTYTEIAADGAPGAVQAAAAGGVQAAASSGVPGAASSGVPGAASGRQQHLPVQASNLQEAAIWLIGWLEKQTGFDQVKAIGHRIVHGMDIKQATLIDEYLLKRLRNITSYDPDHLPGEIELIEVFRKQHPRIPQVACFDTAFHAHLPRVARLLPIPRRFDAEGIRRYGFHGLSYEYIMKRLEQMLPPFMTNGKMILAHLGNGASLAAVRGGKSIDTSMGFTPAGGLMMGSRPGDIDPGVAWYMMQKDGLTASTFNDMVNHQCGLLGVSETSSDMQDLMRRAGMDDRTGTDNGDGTDSGDGTDYRAAEAIALFCYTVKKWIGAFTAALGGLETIVFSGGIGENIPTIRARICEGLGYLDLELDNGLNEKNAVLISTHGSRVAVYVIPTNEEYMIAEKTNGLLARAPDEQAIN
jgi:acetate kinase